MGLELACEFKCGAKISQDELETLFQKDEPETLAKLKRFRLKKEEESDPDLRWCIKPGCKGKMKGHTDATELKCPECGTSICFRCREEWHGKDSCEKAMENTYK